MDSPDGNSAGTVIPRVNFFPSGSLNDESSTKAKCNKCETVTTQFQCQIVPMPVDPPDPMKLLELAKRLIMCSHCGSMRLVN